MHNAMPHASGVPVILPSGFTFLASGFPILVVVSVRFNLPSTSGLSIKRPEHVIRLIGWRLPSVCFILLGGEHGTSVVKDFLYFY
ncbi:MAG: hypothetical protein WDZ31_01705 [Phycisphaeraceae bacterium]